LFFYGIILKKRIIISLVFYLIISSSLICKSEFTNLPVDFQIKFIITTLKYDYNFVKNLGDKIYIGLYFSDNNDSLKYKKQFVEIFTERYKGKTFYELPVELKVVSDIKELQKNKYDLLFIAPGTREYLSRILKFTSDKKVTSATGVVEYLNFGISIVVGIKNGKSFLGINLKSAKKEGCDFSVKILKLATIINNNEN